MSWAGLNMVTQKEIPAPEGNRTSVCQRIARQGRIMNKKEENLRIDQGNLVN